MKDFLRARRLKKNRRADGPPGYWNPDIAVTERIRAAYLRALKAYRPESSPIWGHIPVRQTDVHDALVEGGERLRSMLSDPAATNLYYGVDMMCVDVLATTPVVSQESQIEGIAKMLATFLGIIGADRLPNPEGGLNYKIGAAPTRPMEELLELLDGVFPAPVDFPNPFRAEVYVARSSKGYISHRSIHALYQTYRLLQCSPRGKARCLEIGGGLGRTAYHSIKAGIPNYTIIDLPMAGVGQACYLIATLGPENVSLFGEDDSSAAVRLRPPQWLFATKEQFDVALNSDSLAEMSHEYAEQYVAFAKANCRAFISFNHEANHVTVRELWPGLLRFPYLLRPGYLEEFTPSACSPTAP